MQKEKVYISALGWVIRRNPRGQETFCGFSSCNSYELFVISCPNTSKRLFSIVVSFDNGDVKMVTFFFFFEETVLNVPFSPLYYKFYYDLFVWIPEISVFV